MFGCCCLDVWMLLFGWFETTSWIWMRVAVSYHSSDPAEYLMHTNAHIRRLYNARQGSKNWGIEFWTQAILEGNLVTKRNTDEGFLSNNRGFFVWPPRGVYHQALVKSEDMFAVCHSRVILAIFAYIFRLVTFGNWKIGSNSQSQVTLFSIWTCPGTARRVCRSDIFVQNTIFIVSQWQNWQQGDTCAVTQAGGKMSATHVPRTAVTAVTRWSSHCWPSGHRSLTLAPPNLEQSLLLRNVKREMS